MQLRTFGATEDSCYPLGVRILCETGQLDTDISLARVTASVVYKGYLSRPIACLKVVELFTSLAMAPALTVPQAEEALLNGLKKNGVHVETKFEVSEDYEGDYRFAPIEEAQVSRAMIKRYVLTRGQ